MKVGSLVECVHTLECVDSEYIVLLPIKGKIYSIRDIERFFAGVGILLEEINNQPYNFNREGTQEPYFPVGAFREILPPIENIEAHVKENTLEPQSI